MKTIIKIVCAYCRAHIGEKDGEGQTGVSHGVCAECLAREMLKVKGGAK